MKKKHLIDIGEITTKIDNFFKDDISYSNAGLIEDCEEVIKNQNEMIFKLTIAIQDLRAIIRSNRNSSENGLKQTDWVVK